jgi:hypothetical protein
MPPWCILLGQIRNEELFEEAIAPIARLRGEGRIAGIVISTWNEELLGNPFVSKFAAKYKCEVVASPDPGIDLYPGSDLKSSMAPQTIALRQALKLIGDDEIVLKTRPDLVFHEPFLRKLLRRNEAEDMSTPKGSPLKRKIWVPWVDLVLPFLIADETFMGRSGDLKLLATDFYKQYRPGKKAHEKSESVHILRWLPPFETGAFADFYKNWFFLQHELPGLPGGWRDYLVAKFQTQAWWLLIAKYIMILTDNFVVDAGDVRDIVFFIKSSQITNKSFPKTPCHFYPGMEIPFPIDPHGFTHNFTKCRAKSLVLNDMQWLNNLRHGNIRGEEFYESAVKPSFGSVLALEARRMRPDLGRGVLETLRQSHAADFDPAPMSDPDWQINRLRPGEEVRGAA